jgi:hypothetical protein
MRELHSVALDLKTYSLGVVNLGDLEKPVVNFFEGVHAVLKGFVLCREPVIELEVHSSAGAAGRLTR